MTKAETIKHVVCYQTVQRDVPYYYDNSAVLL